MISPLSGRHSRLRRIRKSFATISSNLKRPTFRDMKLDFALAFPMSLIFRRCKSAFTPSTRRAQRQSASPMPVDPTASTSTLGTLHCDLQGYVLSPVVSASSTVVHFAPDIITRPQSRSTNRMSLGNNAPRYEEQRSSRRNSMPAQIRREAPNAYVRVPTIPGYFF
ncbi:hypothetical protein GALMADRAFT_1037404 [Galerina marginata CBS 339.88]|uniref:Uncharacterized protein n=1 Tax=Galerina marginata (strain CBS 339.88) TaxID=685588 RepID=A0A067SCE7_GALM3|nr:hypothetical protein GALMADRAFT_1037404 [Galerina marginata CBS 339.88]